MSLIGVIGGSGLYDIPGLRLTEEMAVATPYGEPSSPYRIGEMDGVRAAFLPRHGHGHNVPPHKINYRANIWGFRELGVQRIISVNATGGIGPSLSPGDIVVADQVLDMTMGARQSTFYDGGEVVHVDFTEPFCPELRRAVLEAGRSAGVPLRDSGAYVCVNGPRLESRAEIEFFRSIGADVVGMTGMPEASLARELEICYSMMSVVTNYAAGLTGKKLTTVEVVEKMKASNETIKTLLAATFGLVPAERKCPCGSALQDSRM